MDKLRFVIPLCFLAVALYLFALAMGPGEVVEVIPGHDVPERLAVMLGAVCLFGAIAAGVEAFNGKRNQHRPADASRA